MSTDLWRDIVQAIRAYRRAPAYVLTVAALLAIGIGANTAVLGVIDAAFFRPLPVPNPDEIIAVFSRSGPVARKAPLQANSQLDYLTIRDAVIGVNGLASYEMVSLRLGDSLAGASAFSAVVSGNYFKVLRVGAQRGRVLDDGDAREASAEGPVVISDAFWRDRFARAPSVIGSRLTVGRSHFTVVGVAPAGFTGMHPEGRTDLWIPYGAAAELVSPPSADARSNRRAAIIGRLKPGATLAAVQTSLNNVARDLAQSFPATDADLSLVVARHNHLVAFDESPGALATLSLVWVLILLIHLVACSNVAMLVLARTNARRGELGVRICLGASRRQIIQQSLVESSGLAAFGAIGGTLIAYWIIQLIARIEFLSAFQIGLEPRILIIVVLITIVTALQVGLWPAREAARVDPGVLLGGASGGRVVGLRGTSTRVIIVAQVAVSLVLATNAVVLLRTFQRQVTATPGYDLEHLVVGSLALPRGMPHGKAEWRAAYDDAIARAHTIPDVVAVTASNGAPLYRPTESKVVDVPTHVYARGESHEVSTQKVGPGYFNTLAVDLLSGREFNDSDIGVGVNDKFNVVVINRAMAKHYWGDADPVGKSIRIGTDVSATIVGVVSDIHDVSPSIVAPRVYVPLLEGLYAPFEVIVRTRGSARAAVPSLRRALATLAPTNEPPKVVSMREIMEQATMLTRVASLCLTACAGVALLLTAVGLYGMVAGFAAARRSEIGVRIALGARRHHIHSVLLQTVLRLVLIGCAIGGVAAAILVRIEAGMWGPSVSLDPLGVAIAVTAFLVTAGVAAFLPAHRAAGLNPAIALSAVG